MKCPNCGYEKSWKTGRELEKQYNVTILGTPLDDLCSPICQCNHHIRDHKNPGTAGICKKCGGFPVHNFVPKEHTRRERL